MIDPGFLNEGYQVMAKPSARAFHTRLNDRPNGLPPPLY